MSANDILDVLNVQREVQPARKKQKPDDGGLVPSAQKGMARELYNLLGPNTPPIQLGGGGGGRIKPNARPSPWTRMPFAPAGQSAVFHHWQKGSRELLELEQGKGYAFDKFNTKLSLPEMVDEDTYNRFVAEFREEERAERARAAAERQRVAARAAEKQRELEERERAAAAKAARAAPVPGAPASAAPAALPPPAESPAAASPAAPLAPPATSPAAPLAPSAMSPAAPLAPPPSLTSSSQTQPQAPPAAPSTSPSRSHDSPVKTEAAEDEPLPEPWSYQETVYLFDLCNAFELKWPVIADRYQYDRTQEDLKEHFYRVCCRILEPLTNSNPHLLEQLKQFLKSKEVERKQYLENLLKRTPAEIAEEELLVIEARRFELAAKKMLVERLYLLNLLDLPQLHQLVLQYQSSQGLAQLYNNLMIIDKNQKKRQQQQQQKQIAHGGGSSAGSHANGAEPVPPAIPSAASSSFKKERTFQTHLQQYLAGVLKQQGALGVKNEPSAIQQLLSKRLTVKEEEAYGLHYHANEKLVPGVTLRSAQRLPGSQQRQSVLKSVNSLLQEMDIPTAGGTNWKPVMPTRKTMAKYDTLLRAVVALLEVKKGKDKLESEIRLIKAQRDA